jgi:hypothetical protein
VLAFDEIRMINRCIQYNYLSFSFNTLTVPQLNFSDAATIDFDSITLIFSRNLKKLISSIENGQ